MPYLVFSDNLLQDAYIRPIVFQNIVDNFEIANKTWSVNSPTLSWEGISSLYTQDFFPILGLNLAFQLSRESVCDVLCVLASQLAFFAARFLYPFLYPFYIFFSFADTFSWTLLWWRTLVRNVSNIFLFVFITKHRRNAPFLFQHYFISFNYAM